MEATNAQTAADAAGQIIVAVAVTNEPSDEDHLGPMLDPATHPGQGRRRW